MSELPKYRWEEVRVEGIIQVGDSVRSESVQGEMLKIRGTKEEVDALYEGILSAMNNLVSQRDDRLHLMDVKVPTRYGPAFRKYTVICASMVESNESTDYPYGIVFTQVDPKLGIDDLRTGRDAILEQAKRGSIAGMAEIPSPYEIPGIFGEFLKSPPVKRALRKLK